MQKLRKYVFYKDIYFVKENEWTHFGAEIWLYTWNK